jgi:diacylglycerol O-acyltransferase
MRERMGPVDAAWMRMDSAENTADVVALLAFDAVPDPDRLRRLVEERLLTYPRFRQRVVTGAGGHPVWEDDPSFRVDQHLTSHRIAGGDDALRAEVGRVATVPLHPGRPLWRLDLVEGGGAGALVAKLHHCLADGFALVSLLLSLADGDATTPAHAHALPAYRRFAPWLEGGVALARSLLPKGGVRARALEAAGMAAALVRIAAVKADPPTVLNRPLSGRRRVAWSGGIPLARVRAAAKREGATLNDALMGALAGALRGHLVAAGERVDRLSLRALVPVNLRAGPPAPGAPLGNRFGLVFLDLPLWASTPRARREAVRRSMEGIKRRPDALATFGVLAGLGLVPALAPWATGFFSRKASLVVTNVPGPRAALHLAGERIDHAMFWVPHPAALGVGVSILSYAGDLRIGVRADEACLSDPGDLVRRFEEELAAWSGAGGVSVLK